MVGVVRVVVVVIVVMFIIMVVIVVVIATVIVGVAVVVVVIVGVGVMVVIVAETVVKIVSVCVTFTAFCMVFSLVPLPFFQHFNNTFQRRNFNLELILLNLRLAQLLHNPFIQLLLSIQLLFNVRFHLLLLF